ncbi:MAG: DNA (cytosine-5-)-methyltransferase [Methanobrevibacter sp.]|jgi:DNA (cytosine-5)-methyltransferase 1|nr:DNA (cytosine-5-)-methyltransferase [Candidatus Methanoflexus mossambicus]
MNNNEKNEFQSDLSYFTDKSLAKNKNKNLEFTFIDLFSGIGGFRLAFESIGGKCVFSSDIDKWANETYFLNFGEYPKGNIEEINADQIPDHDILCAGFPCQPFSIGGYRKGFCDTRGTLFFEIERILRDKLPKAFILENVKGLINHDKGNTFKIIKKSLKNLGYSLFYDVLNSKDYGIPQNRERIYIVGFKEKINNFKFPEKINEKTNAMNVLEKNLNGFSISEIAEGHLEHHFGDYKNKKKIKKQYPLFASEIRPSRCSFRNDGISPCLTAKMGTGGNNVPILVDEKRKLSVRECLRLQGFPESYKMKENYSQSYKQIGNSVTVPVIKYIGEKMIKTIF